MRTRPTFVALVASVFALLVGCAPAANEARVPAATEATPAASPTVTQAPQEQLPGSIVLAGSYWELRNAEGQLTSSFSYTEPVATALENLVEVLGDDYVLTEYLADDGCGQAPSHNYVWGDGAFGLSDSTGLTTDAPYDVVPYHLWTSAREVDGITITTVADIAIGDDMVAAINWNAETDFDVLLLDQGGSYTYFDEIRPWGLFVSISVDLHTARFLSAPAVQTQFYC